MKPYEKIRGPHIIFGNDTSKEAGRRMAEYGIKKCLVVTDKGVEKLNLLDNIVESLTLAGIEYLIYDDVLPDPPDYICIACADIINDNHCDGVLAVGGGSTIDTAKAAALIANFPERPNDLFDYSVHGTKMKLSLKRNAFFVAIPTTAGTGAETTGSAVVSDTKRGVKYSFLNENEVADIAIIDPLLTVGMPARSTANCGMDILAHSIECLVGTASNEYMANTLLDCVQRTWQWLPIAMKEPNNVEAREQLAWSAHNALFNSGVPNGHAVAHAMGSIYHLVHGHACAIVLPTVVRHFSESSAPMIAELGKRMNVPLVGDPIIDGNRVADMMLNFYKSLGLTTFQETMKLNGITDTKEEFREKMIPAIMVDYKVEQWLPPIHTGNYEEKIGAVCDMIYDEV